MLGCICLATIRGTGSSQLPTGNFFIETNDIHLVFRIILRSVGLYLLCLFYLFLETETIPSVRVLNKILK